MLEQVIRDGECRNVQLWQLNDDANLISLGKRSCSHRFKDPEKHPCYLQLNACCMGGSEGHWGGINGRIRSTVSQQGDTVHLSSWAYLEKEDNYASLDGLLEFKVASDD